MKKLSYNFYLKIGFILWLWCSVAYGADDQKFENNNELKTTFHVYEGHLSETIDTSQITDEPSIESIKTEAVNMYSQRWKKLGVVGGIIFGGAIGFGLTSLASEYVIENNVNYSFSNINDCSNLCYDYYYNRSIIPTILGGIIGSSFGAYYGKQWGKKGIVIGALGGMTLGGMTNLLLYFTVLSCMNPVINTPFPSPNDFSHLVSMYCFCYPYSNTSDSSNNCAHCNSIQNNDQYYFDSYVCSEQCNCNSFNTYCSTKYYYNNNNIHNNTYDNVYLFNAGFYASTAVISLSGGIIGSYIAKYWGKKVGIKQAQKIISNNRDWIEMSYLDMAFRTTQGEDVVYDLSVRLRPQLPGWIKQKKDGQKTFLSSAKVEWIINQPSESALVEDSKTSALYDEIFSYQKAETIKKDFQDHTFLMLSDEQIHVPYEQLKTCEVFRGTLPHALSIHRLINAICEIKPKDSDFPVCSWSGQSHHKNGLTQHIINPSIFTCRLLDKLGIQLHNTELSRFLIPYSEDTPVTRELVVVDLYKNRNKLYLQPNEQNIKKIFRDYQGIINPLIREILGSSTQDGRIDIEKDLLKKERQVKIEVAQCLLNDGVSLDTVYEVTGLTSGDLSEHVNTHVSSSSHNTRQEFYIDQSSDAGGV